ncbi:MAG: ABC transporter permease [Acidobacteria bacterium]|jgi:lipopolysaccharide transport system permease protein|nr:ABC transporter permease [Acidobacteriota bacterium]
MASNSVLSNQQSAARQIKVIRAPSFSPARLLADLNVLAHYRDLLYTLSAHRIKVRYKQSILGVSWAIVQPLALMLIYTLIFTFIAKVPTSGDVPYPVLLYTALLIWTYFSTALTNATNGLVSHNHLVTKVYFPREILPLTYVVAALFDLLIASPVLLGLMLYYGVPLTFNALYVIPIILIMTMFITAATLVSSAAQVRFRDIGMALPLLLQIWMFATPVVYPLSAVPERFRPLYMLNPMVGVVENFRRVLVEAAPPNFYELGISALIAVIMLPLAYIFFKHIEATVADVI